MNTKWMIVLLLALFVLDTYGQKNDRTKKGEAQHENVNYEVQRRVFQQALTINDLGVATQALHQMIALNPENRALKDSLAFLYYNGGAHLQVVLLGKQILETDPDKKDILELVAASEQSLGAMKEALTDFEKLYRVSDDLHHLYQIASLQYNLKRFGECSVSVNAILANQEAKTRKANITIGQGRSQQVPLDAAAFNMKGVIALDMKQLEEAAKNFEQALLIFPEFELAQMNKKSLEENKTSPK